MRYLHQLALPVLFSAMMTAACPIPASATDPAVPAAAEQSASKYVLHIEGMT